MAAYMFWVRHERSEFKHKTYRLSVLLKQTVGKQLDGTVLGNGNRPERRCEEVTTSALRQQ